MRYNLTAEPQQTAELFEQAVREQIAEAEAMTLRVVHSLTPLQSAVLRVMAANERQFSPYEAETMAAYQQTLAQIAPGNDLKPDTSNVQQALGALQDKSLI